MALADPFRGHALGIGSPEHWPQLALGVVRPQRPAHGSGRRLCRIGYSPYGLGLCLRVIHLEDRSNQLAVSQYRAGLYLQFWDGTLIKGRCGLRNKTREPGNHYTGLPQIRRFSVILGAT